jgi:hypothetical protein
MQTLADDIWHRKEKTEKYPVHINFFFFNSYPGPEKNIPDQQNAIFRLKIKICLTVIYLDLNEGFQRFLFLFWTSFALDPGQENCQK